MSASEIILVAGAAAVGVAVGSFGIYLYSGGNSSRQSLESPNDSSPSKMDSSYGETEEESNKNDAGRGPESSRLSVQENSRSIPRNELEKSKRELRTLLVQKELVSAALTRLYEAEAAKEITKSEREVLGAKYVSELKELDEKITKMDAFIQIGDLETLRNQLLQLVEQKIDSIEKRIESTRKLAEPLIAQMMMKQQQSAPQLVQQEKSVDETQRGTPIPDISDMLQNERPEPRIDPGAEQPQTVIATVVTAQSEIPKSTPPPPVVERKRPSDKVEELQKEILEALDRLERLDVESV